MMPALEGLRDALATIPGVNSCKIGLEANISPADYPLIRVVPSRGDAKHQDVQGNLVMRGMETLIYFGLPVSETDNGGLEGVYRALFDLEAAIVGKFVPAPAGTLSIEYLETITDEDRLDTYKVMALRCRVAA